LQLALSAKREIPGDPGINDTLGWVYAKKNMPGMAIPRFQQAIDTSPKVPLYHYHLGVTYAQAGEDSKARRALERALQLDPRFDGAADARRVLGTLVY